MNLTRAPLLISAILGASLTAPCVFALAPAHRADPPAVRFSVPAAASSVLSFQTSPAEPASGSQNAAAQTRDPLRASAGLGFISAGIAGSVSFPESTVLSFAVVPSAFVTMAQTHSVHSFSSIGIRECFAVFAGASDPYSVFIGRTPEPPAGFDFLYPVEPSSFFGGESAIVEDYVSVSVSRLSFSVDLHFLPFAPDFFASDPAGPLFDRRDVLGEFTTTGLLETTYILDSIRYSEDSPKSSRAFILDPSAALRAGWAGDSASFFVSAFAGRDRQPAVLWRFLYSAAVNRTYNLYTDMKASRVTALSLEAETWSGLYRLSLSASAVAGRLYASGDPGDPLLRGDWLPVEERTTVISTVRLALDPFASGLLLLTGEWSHSLCLDDPGNIRRPFMDRRIRANAAVNLPRYAGVGAQVSCDYALSLLDGSFLVSPAVTLSSVSGASAVFRYTAAYGESDTELGQFAREGTVWCSVFLRCP